jgi:hypothetical protein
MCNSRWLIRAPKCSAEKTDVFAMPLARTQQHLERMMSRCLEAASRVGVCYASGFGNKVKSD